MLCWALGFVGRLKGFGVADQIIYLDHHAHTPIDPAVRTVLSAAYDTYDVNPHAGSRASEDARQVIEGARTAVAGLLGAAPADVIFTSGATESNNLAVQGVAAHLLRQGRRKVIVSAAEHASVLSAAEALGPEFVVVQAPLRRTGEIDLEALERLATPDTGLISIAAANHEIGTLQPLAAIAAIAAGRGALFHSDLAQAFGKTALDLTGVHLASVTAHKLYGPLGVGALMARRPVRRILQPIVCGGGQEGGLRSGTLSAPLCVAFGAACDLAAAGYQEEEARLRGLRADLLARLEAQVELRVNGGLESRLAGNLNLRFPGVDAEALVMRLRDRVVVATGSACRTRALEPSHVLAALGLTLPEAESSIRIGLGRSTTNAEVVRAADAIAAAVTELRAVRQRARA